jgi:hypothetical protein
MKLSAIFTLAIISLVIFSSCSFSKKHPPEIENLINNTSNHNELKKILDHYSAMEDSLQLKAAYFYLRGLNGRYYYQGNQLDKYKNLTDLDSRVFMQGDYIKNSALKMYGKFSYDNVNIQSPLETLKADSLIKSIDFALKVWKQQPWSKDYSFDSFCNYVLPFFIGNEVPEYNREDIYRRYNPFLDSLRKKGGTAIEAAYIINQKLKNEGWGFTTSLSYLPNLGPTRILKHRVGSCREMANLATYVMRALGIPVGEEFLPQWPQRNLGHNWNVIFKPDGSSIMFLGADDSPGTGHFPGVKRGKIFRNVFLRNVNSLSVLKVKGEEIPEFLDNAFIEDVTRKYVNCEDIDVVLGKQSYFKHSYLSIFNNTGWQPVDWAIVEDSKSHFKNVETDIVYLPGFFTKKAFIAGNYPFLLAKDGRIDYLKPDYSKSYSLTCSQIFPAIPHMVDRNSLVGGSFQAANNADFSDAVTVYYISDRNKPSLGFNVVKCSLKKPVRYIRYMKPRERSTDCNLAELSVSYKGKPYNAHVFNAESSSVQNLSNINNLIDNDLTTAYINKDTRSESWIALDLKKPEMIDSLKFAAGNHDEHDKLYVIPGHQYGLWGWGELGWKLLATNTAKGATVNFNKVPANTLFFLHDDTENRRARIFIYKDNKIVWY